MKKFRKIMAVLVAAIMVVAMTVPAWAATITIYQNNATGTAGPETYKFYKIFDVKKTDGAKNDDSYTKVNTSVVTEPEQGVTYYTRTTTYTAQNNLPQFKNGVDYYVLNSDGTYTKATEYHSSVTYYTIDTDVYQAQAGLTSFSAGTDYYTKSNTDKINNYNDGVHSNLGQGTDQGYAYTIKTDNLWFAKLGSVNGTTGEWSAATSPSAQRWVTLTKTAGDSTTYNVTLNENMNSGAEAEAFAEWLYAAGIDIVSPIARDYEKAASTDGSGVVTQTVDDGYYLVTSTLGTSLVLATSNIRINTKNQFVTDSKAIENDKHDYNIGDYVKFIITVNLPATTDWTESVTVHDTMDNVLKVVNDVISGNDYRMVANLDGATDGNFTQYVNLSTGKTNNHNESTHAVTDSQTGYDFVLDLDSLVSSGATAHTIVIEYYAELLSTAAADTKYYNTEYTEFSKFTTKPNTVWIHTFDIDIEKWFENDETNTSLNATFWLYPTDSNTSRKATDPLEWITDGTGYKLPDEDDTATPSKVITVTQGTKTNLRGLEKGTYYLTEKSASEGYIMLTEDVVIHIDDNGVVKYDFDGITDSAGSGYSPVAAGTQFDANKTYCTETPRDRYTEVTSNVTSANYVASTYYTTTNNVDYTLATGNYNPSSRYFEKTTTYEYAKDTGVTSENIETKIATGLYTLNTVRIVNKTGTILPSTGGMGTTVLYIVGGMLVILAGAYLFFSRRRTA